jgi:hypothetical protein
MMERENRKHQTGRNDAPKDGSQGRSGDCCQWPKNGHAIVAQRKPINRTAISRRMSDFFI